jgi:hypothetical protein
VREGKKKNKILIFAALLAIAFSTACTDHNAISVACEAEVDMPACLNGVCVATADFDAFTCVENSYGDECTADGLW